MADFTKLVESMKKAALDAVNASNPLSVMFGEVESSDPLKINAEQKLTLDSSQIILTRNVTEHTIEMSVEHRTENETGHVHTIHDTYTGGGISQPTTHNHDYTGRKKFVIHNELKVGEKVVLIRIQGGQRFLVIDRLGAK